ncbi:hypothetical protein [Cobetia crustatorum]|uniref:hypothetical protein n=1 Tax=Cobetia crustatorum TaxID=553385 RepID=UPI001644D184|nr:hypothetical protein [Cobetia crustatorum]
MRSGNVPLGSERLILADAISRSGRINEISDEASGVFVIRSKPITAYYLGSHGLRAPYSNP